MGCGVSSARVGTASDKREPTSHGTSRRRLHVQLTEHDFPESLKYITKSVSSITVPGGMISIAVLNRLCFAIATAPLHIETGSTSKLYLPVVAASVAKLGRVMCFSHIDMLSKSNFETRDTSNFIHNAFGWATAHRSLMTPVGIIGMHSVLLNETRQLIRSLGFSAEPTSFDENLDKFELLIIPSNEDFSLENISILDDYTEKGGGVAIFFSSDPDNPEVAYNANNFLYKYGLSFTFCSVSPADRPPYHISIHSTFERVESKNLLNLKENFKTIIDLENVSFNKIDDIIIELHYNLMVCQDDQRELFEEIYELCWYFLHKTEYKTDGGEFCPRIEQSIIIVLMQDIVDRFPPEEISAHPDSPIFPGMAPESERKDIQLELTITDHSLTSTGLWLNAGTLATIEVVGSLPEGVRIQVGAQSESLITEPRPWRRWPTVAAAFPLEAGVNNIASQFGGIVLLATAELPDGPTKIRIRCKNFNLYPRAVEGHPEVLARTGGFLAPWGEIACTKVVITVPRASIVKATDMDAVFEWVERLVGTVTEYMHYEVIRPFRIVFDVQTPNDRPAPGYPIVFPLSMLDGLVAVGKPSPAVFWLLQAIAVGSLREGCFDALTEDALSKIVAATAFESIFGAVDPYAPGLLTREKEELFPTLWAIHKQVSAEILRVLIVSSESQDAPTFDTDDDKWTSFTRDICSAGGMDFSVALAVAHPIPLNISAEVEGLPACPELNLDY